MQIDFFTGRRFLERIYSPVRLWVFFMERDLFGEGLASNANVAMHI